MRHVLFWCCLFYSSLFFLVFFSFYRFSLSKFLFFFFLTNEPKWKKTKTKKLTKYFSIEKLRINAQMLVRRRLHDKKKIKEICIEPTISKSICMHPFLATCMTTWVCQFKTKRFRMDVTNWIVNLPLRAYMPSRRAQAPSQRAPEALCVSP